MKIARRDFLKMLGVLGTSLVASDLPVSKEVSRLSESVMLPDSGPITTDVSPQISVNAVPGADFRITSLNVKHDKPWRGPSSASAVTLEQLSTAGSSTSVWIPSGSPLGSHGMVRVDMEATAYCDQATADALWVWFKTNKRLPIWHQEWICLYCGSAQPVTSQSCRNCGGARNWVLT